MPVDPNNPFNLSQKEHEEVALLGDPRIEGFNALAQLSHTDLNRLRAVVRKVHMHHFPGSTVSDYEADKMIAAIHPRTCEIIIKKMVDAGNV